MPSTPEARVEQIKKAAGESKGLMDFFNKTTSTRLAVAAFLIWITYEMSLASVESHALFALGCLALSVVTGVAYIASETAVRVASIFAVCKGHAQETPEAGNGATP